MDGLVSCTLGSHGPGFVPCDPAVPLTRGHSLIGGWQTVLVTSYVTGPEGAHLLTSPGPSVALRTRPRAAVGQRDVE